MSRELNQEGRGIVNAVDAAIFNVDNEVLLGKRLSKFGFGSWCFPGGHLDKDEKLIEGAKREIKEELGRDVNVELSGQIIAVRDNRLLLKKMHYITVIVKGMYVDGEPRVNEPDKCEKWEWFSLDDLPRPLFLGVEEILESYKKGVIKVVTIWEE